MFIIEVGHLQKGRLGLMMQRNIYPHLHIGILTTIIRLLSGLFHNRDFTTYACTRLASNVGAVFCWGIFFTILMPPVAYRDPGASFLMVFLWCMFFVLFSTQHIIPMLFVKYLPRTLLLYVILVPYLF